MFKIYCFAISFRIFNFSHQKSLCFSQNMSFCCDKYLAIGLFDCVKIFRSCLLYRHGHVTIKSFLGGFELVVEIYSFNSLLLYAES